MSTVFPFGAARCIDCKAPVAIVRRTVVQMCAHCDFHGGSYCQCAKAHHHAIPDVAWAVVDAEGERHLCPVAV